MSAIAGAVAALAHTQGSTSSAASEQDEGGAQQEGVQHTQGSAPEHASTSKQEEEGAQHAQRPQGSAPEHVNPINLTHPSPERPSWPVASGVFWQISPMLLLVCHLLPAPPLPAPGLCPCIIHAITSILSPSLLNAKCFGRPCSIPQNGWSRYPAYCVPSHALGLCLLTGLATCPVLSPFLNTPTALSAASSEAAEQLPPPWEAAKQLLPLWLPSWSHTPIGSLDQGPGAGPLGGVGVRGKRMEEGGQGRGRSSGLESLVSAEEVGVGLGEGAGVNCMQGRARATTGLQWMYGCDCCVK